MPLALYPGEPLWFNAMAKINQPPPKTPLWPWGGPRSVRERLVDPAQFDRKRQIKKAGDPKNPALASFALMEFIGPAHSSDELRLPMPALPKGHDADLAGFVDQPFLGTVAQRAENHSRMMMDQCLGWVRTNPDRKARLDALRECEDRMLQLVNGLYLDVREIRERMREAQEKEGY